MSIGKVKTAARICQKAGFPFWALCAIASSAGGVGFALAQAWAKLTEKPSTPVIQPSAPIIHIHSAPAAPPGQPVPRQPGGVPPAPAPVLRPPAPPVIPVDAAKEAEQLRQITRLTQENQAKDRELEATQLALAQARTEQGQRDVLLRQRDKELEITKQALDQFRQERRKNDALVREREESHKEDLARVRKDLESVQEKVIKLQDEKASLQGQMRAAQRERAAQRVPVHTQRVVPGENIRIGYKPYSELSPAEKKLYAGLP